MASLTLKIKTSSYFSSKNGFIREKQRNAIPSKQPTAKPQNKKEERGGCCKLKVHWRKLGAGSIVTSHWLGCCWGRRKPSFLGLGWQSRVTCQVRPLRHVCSSQRRTLLPPKSVPNKVLETAKLRRHLAELFKKEGDAQ